VVGPLTGLVSCELFFVAYQQIAYPTDEIENFKCNGLPVG
jgi:hypothetical protein